MVDRSQIDMDDVLVGFHLPVSNLSTLRELWVPDKDGYRLYLRFKLKHANTGI